MRPRQQRTTRQGAAPRSGIQLDWHGNDALRAIADATPEMLLAIGLQIEGQAKANIVANGQVDTGFMLNSVYTTDGGNGSTYATAQRQASSKSGDAEMAPQAAPPPGGVAVAVGADYAIHQETRNSFLYRAAEMVAGGAAEGEIERVAREQGLTDG